MSIHRRRRGERRGFAERVEEREYFFHLPLFRSLWSSLRELGVLRACGGDGRAESSTPYRKLTRNEKETRHATFHAIFVVHCLPDHRPAHNSNRGPERREEAGQGRGRKRRVALLRRRRRLDQIFTARPDQQRERGETEGRVDMGFARLAAAEREPDALFVRSGGHSVDDRR